MRRVGNSKLTPVSALSEGDLIHIYIHADVRAYIRTYTHTYIQMQFDGADVSGSIGGSHCDLMRRYYSFEFK